MPTRYLIVGTFSVIIVIVLSQIVAKYNQMAGEVLSMDMVFIPISFCIMVIIEGTYQIIYWLCKKIHQ